MTWITPDFEEFKLNCEINCYCSAETGPVEVQTRDTSSRRTTSFDNGPHAITAYAVYPV